MTSRTTAAALSLATLVVASAPAAGGRLDPDHVAHDAAWLVHVDVEWLVRSTTGSFLLDHADELDIDLHDLEDLERDLGIDPFEDILSITAYGRDDDDDGVLVAVTSDAVEDALERLVDEFEERHRVLRTDGFRIHRFADGGDEHHYLHVRGDGDERVVVMSDDRGALVDALRVIAGRDDHLDARHGRSEEGPQPGSIVFFSARDLSMIDEFEPASRIARIASAVTVDIGERRGDISIVATIRADDDHEAKDVGSVVQGLLALGRLMAGDDDELAPIRAFFDAVTIETIGDRIALRVRYDAESLIEDLRAIDEIHWDEDDD